MPLSLNFNVANMSFNAIRENKIIAKISGFTVIFSTYVQYKLVLSQLRSIFPAQKFRGLLSRRNNSDLHFCLLLFVVLLEFLMSRLVLKEGHPL